MIQIGQGVVPLDNRLPAIALFLVPISLEKKLLFLGLLLKPNKIEETVSKHVQTLRLYKEFHFFEVEHNETLKMSTYSEH